MTNATSAITVSRVPPTTLAPPSPLATSHNHGNVSEVRTEPHATVTSTPTDASGRLAQPKSDKKPEAMSIGSQTSTKCSDNMSVDTPTPPRKSTTSTEGTIQEEDHDPSANTSIDPETPTVVANEPMVVTSQYPEEEAVPFVDGWKFIRTLGEGAFGQVRLALSEESGVRIAVKIIDFTMHPMAQSAVDKEVKVHKRLRHENIIEFYGDRLEQDVRYIYLEYADGGELYDKIHPDKGLGEHHLARKYFHQLLLAVQYIHTKGFTHRDIKCENILITKQDSLKLIDFGLATVFRFNGQERLLSKRCGTPPYLAPEVLVGKRYHAAPAELWSCGIVLVAMLAGELPWSEASTQSNDFNAWIDKDPAIESRTPWTKMDMDAMIFVRKILHFRPEKRLTIEKVLDHRWMNPDRQKFKSQKIGDISKKLAKSRIRAAAESPLLENEPCIKRSKLCQLPTNANHGGLVTSSQKIYREKFQNFTEDRIAAEVLDTIFDDDSRQNSTEDQENRHPTGLSSTQPSNITEMLVSKSQVPTGFSQFLSQNRPDISSRLFETRTTKIWVSMEKIQVYATNYKAKNPDATVVPTLASIFERITKDLNLVIVGKDHAKIVLQPVKVASNNAVPLQFVVYVNKKLAGKQIKLLDFRLSKGCGMDFKRHFVAIHQAMKKFIVSNRELGF